MPKSDGSLQGDARPVMLAPAVESATCEIVLATQLALRGHEMLFKVHAARCFPGPVGTPADGRRGVPLIFGEAARTVDWLRKAHGELLRSTPTA
jgi:hypothetical protein